MPVHVHVAVPTKPRPTKDKIEPQCTVIVSVQTLFNMEISDYVLNNMTSLSPG